MAVLGITGAFLVLVAGIFAGGVPTHFLNPGGFLLVVVGTAFVTIVSFSRDDLARFPRMLGSLFSERDPDVRVTAQTLLRMAARARKEGALTLEQAIPAGPYGALMRRSIELVIDGHDAPEIETILQRDAQSLAGKQQRLADILRRAGDIAPAMGLIGTLIGLVQMLGQLDDPAKLGPGMAMALLTTLYGAVLSHMVFLPLANRAERKRDSDYLVHSVLAIGAGGIGRRDHPRRIETLINSILPPHLRIEATA